MYMKSNMQTELIFIQIRDSADQDQMSVLGGLHVANLHDALLPTTSRLQQFQPLGRSSICVLARLGQHVSLRVHPRTYGARSHTDYHRVHLCLHLLYYEASEAVCCRARQGVHHSAHSQPCKPWSCHVICVSPYVLGVLGTMCYRKNVRVPLWFSNKRAVPPLYSVLDRCSKLLLEVRHLHSFKPKI